MDTRIKRKGHVRKRAAQHQISVAKPTKNRAELSTAVCWTVLSTALWGIVAIREAHYWLAFFSDSFDRSWDGSGHVALLHIYDNTVFPDTFGWVGAFFGGMPFPNFYPPLWFWSLSALHHLGFPLTATYKVLVLFCVLMTPILLARLAYVLTRSLTTSMIAMSLTFIPLLAAGMMPQYAAGLTLSSTFNQGLYPEALGFALALVTITSVLENRTLVGCIWPSLLAAMTLLANVFTFLAVLPFLAGYARPWLSGRRRESINSIVIICGALLITAFWWVPVLTHYTYFVTEPVRPPLGQVITSPMGLWLAAGLLSTLLMLPKSRETGKVFLVGILLLAVACIVSYAPGFESTPLQVPRLIAILVMLSTVPIALALSACGRKVISSFAFVERRLSFVFATTFISSVLMVACIPICNLNAGLHADDEFPELRTLLDFAKRHVDGRYMVQTPRAHHDRFDARALSSYLGIQGNEAATVVFREASVSSLFMVPLQNKLSSLRQPFGISSGLDSDASFINEGDDVTNAQLKELRIRYLIRLKSEASARSAKGQPVFSSGRWEIVSVALDPTESEERLSVAPILVMSALSYKKREPNPLDANWLFEEQFREGIFSPRLVVTDRNTVESLVDLDRYSGLIVSRFTSSDERAAYSLLRRYSQSKPLVIIPDSSALCGRILAHQAEFPHLSVFPADSKDDDAHPESSPGATSDQPVVRALWPRILRAMRLGPGNRDVNAAAMGSSIERGEGGILLHQTYDPSWRSNDGSPVLLAGPAATFVSSVSALPLSHRRSLAEVCACFISLFSAIGFSFVIGIRMLMSADSLKSFAE